MLLSSFLGRKPYYPYSQTRWLYSSCELSPYLYSLLFFEYSWKRCVHDWNVSHPLELILSLVLLYYSWLWFDWDAEINLPWRLKQPLIGVKPKNLVAYAETWDWQNLIAGKFDVILQDCIFGESFECQDRGNMGEQAFYMKQKCRQFLTLKFEPATRRWRVHVMRFEMP